MKNKSAERKKQKEMDQLLNNASKDLAPGGTSYNKKGKDVDYEDEDEDDFMKEDPAVHEGGRLSRPNSTGS